MTAGGPRPRVVILGGGFAGLYAARALVGESVTVTVVDRTNHHVFQPLLYQVATGVLAPSDITVPIRWRLRGQANATVLLAGVTGIDVVKREVRLDSDPGAVAYDFLVVATGARHAYFGHDEWEAHAPGLKTIEDAFAVRRRFLLALERAERTTDAAVRAAELTIVVVGGGPTGVESAFHSAAASGWARWWAASVSSHATRVGRWRCAAAFQCARTSSGTKNASSLQP